MGETKQFAVWIVGASDVLRGVLEKTPGVRVRVLSDRDMLEPVRYEAKPQLIVIGKEWETDSNMSALIKACANPPVWLDLVSQNYDSVEAFRSHCQARSIEGSALELTTAQLGWVMTLFETYRRESGSLLGGVIARGGDSPVIYSSRIVRPYEIGSRIDYLAEKDADAPALHWYTAVSSLTSLAMDIAKELRSTSMPVLPLYAGELPEKNWFIGFHVPIAKKQQIRVPLVLAKLRVDPALRNNLAFNFVTRECGALVVTTSESLLEVGIVFSPSGIFGGTIGDADRGYREAIVFRKSTAKTSFNPQACVYTPFPERVRPVEYVPETEASVESAEADPAAIGQVIVKGGPSGAPAVPRSSSLFDKAQQKLAKISTAGNDESFVAFLKGVDGASGGAGSRYAKLISAIEKSGTPDQQELLKDLLKRYFKLVDEVKRKQQRAA